MITSFLLHLDRNYKSVDARLVVGQGHKLISDFIEETGLSADRFVVKSVPHYLIHDEFKDADIGFFFIPPRPAKIASSPTKMGEMLAAGLPIITGPFIGDVDSLMKEYQIGSIISKPTPDNFSAALDETIAGLRAERSQMMQRCRQCAKDYFSLENGVERYRAIYEELL
jgi:hypothetical protein